MGGFDESDRYSSVSTSISQAPSLVLPRNIGSSASDGGSLLGPRAMRNGSSRSPRARSSSLTRARRRRNSPSSVQGHLAADTRSEAGPRSVVDQRSLSPLRSVNSLQSQSRASSVLGRDRDSRAQSPSRPL